MIKSKNLPYFSDGHWWVQGLSATFPVKIFNEIYGKRIKKSNLFTRCWDRLLVEKHFQLLDSGYNVSYIREISKRRSVTLKKNSQRTKFKTSIINDDFTSYKHKSKFDSILIDAHMFRIGIDFKKKP